MSVLAEINAVPDFMFHLDQTEVLSTNVQMALSQFMSPITTKDTSNGGIFYSPWILNRLL